MTDPISTDSVGGIPEHTRAATIVKACIVNWCGRVPTMDGLTGFIVDALAAAGALAGLPGPPPIDWLDEVRALSSIAERNPGINLVEVFEHRHPNCGAGLPGPTTPNTDAATK